MVLCSARTSKPVVMCNSLPLHGNCVILYVLPVIAVIFDLPITSTSERVHNRPAVLLDPENVGVAFGMSLQSSIEDEILRYFIRTSGNGGHL